MRKTKPQSRVPRPDVYSQALNTAKKRIEKALVEKAEYETKLAELNEEIPRLQRIIDVFEPSKVKDLSTNTPSVPLFPLPRHEDVFKVPIPRPSEAAMQAVPEHLKRYMAPVVEEADIPANGTGEDQFLPDVE